MLIVVDLETTGLPLTLRGSSSNYKNLKNYETSRIISLSYLCYQNGKRSPPDVFRNFIVKPSFDIPEESVKIHGITNEIAARNGVEISQIFELLASDINLLSSSELSKKSGYLDKFISHNVTFDKNILLSEIYRHDKDNTLLKKISTLPSICTMEMGKAICGARVDKEDGTFYFKYPKLIELYEFLFNKKFENQHTSEADVKACAECYFEMIYLYNF